MQHASYFLRFVVFVAALFPVALGSRPQGDVKPLDASVLNEGVHIHYRIIGKGEPILLLAGGPGFDPDYLLPVAQELGESYQCVLLEQRGTGRSQPPDVNATTVSTDLYLSDFEAVRKQLGFEKWAVLGHSYGTFFAMKYMTLHPDRVSRGLLVATNPPMRKLMEGLGDDLAVRLSPDRLEKLAALANALVQERSDCAFLEYFQFVLPVYFYDPEKGQAFVSTLKPTEVHYRVAELLSVENAQYDLRRALDTLKIPVLILHGRQDVLNVMMPYEVHLAIPSSRMQLFEKCGHFPWIEKPEEFYAAIRAFLQTPTQ